MQSDMHFVGYKLVGIVGLWLLRNYVSHDLIRRQVAAAGSQASVAAPSRFETFMPQLLYIIVSPGQRKEEEFKASYPPCVSVCASISAIRIRGHQLVDGNGIFGRDHPLAIISLFRSRFIFKTLV